MVKTIKLNKEDYTVLDTEFNKIPHDEFNNLTILENLGLFERLISLLNEISSLFENKPSIKMINCTHGGYIPINCSKYYSKIYVHNKTEEHTKNIKDNIDTYGTNNIIMNSFIDRNADIQLYFINQKGYNIDYARDSIILCMDDVAIENKKKYVLSNTDYYLYIPFNMLDKFSLEFYYFIEGDILNYDNLIHYTMIVKNGGDSLENILTENLPIIDRWTILDTGSTDNTIDIINKVLVGKKKGKLYQEPFINFKDSRNRCFELAGKSCKFAIMLDDTYIIKGDLRKFLDTVRGDQFSDSFSMFISSHDVDYCSNRIIKTATELKYLYKIHEVITPKNNVNVIVPRIHSFIFDYRSDFMENRTMSRKEWDLKTLFEELEEDPDDPRALYYIGQTYNLLDKFDLAYEYYLKRVDHPVEGFFQERIDACFEASRMANFKLNKPWEVCEKLYLRSYEMDKTRGDALYFIGINYYLRAMNGVEQSKNYRTAYEYMVKCYELGYPEHCQYSLKPSLHFYFLPKFLTELCYIFGNYEIGKKCAELFLEKTQIIDGKIPFKECYNETEVKTVKSWKDIHALLVQTPKNIVLKNKPPELPYLIFMEDGGFTKWTGKDILIKGMGGAETFTIEMARYLQKSGYFQVIVFCNCEQNETFEGVMYKHLMEYFSFIMENVVHTCIIGRYSEYYPYSLVNGNIENIYMIAHDLDFTGNVIPVDTRLKKIFCLSNWHADEFKNIYSDLKDRIDYFNYGIDFNLFDNSIQKVPFKFIYSSFPIRGLLPLLQMWPKILNRYRNATLHIHSDVDGWWSNTMRKEEMELIKYLLSQYNEIKEIKNSIFYRGWTSKKELADSWMSSDICFYPCTYLETFCHTALEAAYSKTFIISTDLAALKNTIGDRGILLEGNFYDLEFQEKALVKVFEAIENKELKKNLVNKNYEWAKTMSWENRANIFLEEHLKKTITHEPMSPPNFKNIDARLNYANMYNWTNDLPEGQDSYKIFIDILDYIKWKNSGKEINILEIGTFAGTSLIKFLEILPNSKATVIDRWKDYIEHDINEKKITLDNIEKYNIEDIFYKNIEEAEFKDKVKVIKGSSNISLLSLIENKITFDFIYVDGSHMLLDSHTDILLSFQCLNKGGVMGIDDYTYNATDDTIFQSPYVGVNHFLESFADKIKILSKGYRVFIEKL